MARVHLPPLVILTQCSALTLATMEEATMEEGMIADAPGVTTFTLYIPDFLQECSLPQKSLEEQKNELL
jgi:hypothetical protein